MPPPLTKSSGIRRHPYQCGGGLPDPCRPQVSQGMAGEPALWHSRGVQLQQMEMESRFNVSSPRVAASAMFELSEEKASLRPVCFVIARLISLSLVPAAKLVGPASPSGVAPLLSSNGLPEWLILAPSCLFPANRGPVLGVCSCLPPPAARLTHWARRSHPSLSPSLAHPI